VDFASRRQASCAFGDCDEESFISILTKFLDVKL
jgi:hypothetical protein